MKVGQVLWKGKHPPTRGISVKMKWFSTQNLSYYGFMGKMFFINSDVKKSTLNIELFIFYCFMDVFAIWIPVGLVNSRYWIYTKMKAISYRIITYYNSIYNTEIATLFQKIFKNVNISVFWIKKLTRFKLSNVLNCYLRTKTHTEAFIISWSISNGLS